MVEKVYEGGRVNPPLPYWTMSLYMDRCILFMGGDVMKRPYIKKTVYELADIVAKEFATNPTDKKTVRDVQNELEHRGNVVARTVKQLIDTYFINLK